MIVQMRVEPHGRMVELNVERSDPTGPDGFVVHWGDRQAEVGFRLGPRGSGVLRLHGQTIPFHALYRQGQITVWLQGRLYRFEVVDRTARRVREAQALLQEQITAPMPGTIIKIHVAAGESFQADQPLMVMESMKMEISLSVPHGGRVEEVCCREGQLVDLGATLARLSAEHS